MRVVFRVDASVRIGTGHVMRCLTLAGRLRQAGAAVQFVCREHPGHLCGLIRDRGFSVHRLPSPFDQAESGEAETLYEQWLGERQEIDAAQTAAWIQAQSEPVDWLIADHYAIDIRWERLVRPQVRRIMIIDDLANRTHDCDLLLDQNLYDNRTIRYHKLVPAACRQLLGPRYVLLREEFQAARRRAKVKDGAVWRLLVFFGGSDPTNETEKTLRAIESWGRHDIAADVVVGQSNLHRERIAELCSAIPNVRYYCQIDHMAELMLEADLAIGAGGSSTWERCFLGLPAITVTTADNQTEIAKAVSNAGAVLHLGHWDEVTSPMIVSALEQLPQSPDSLASMSRAGLELMGDQGVSGADGVTGILFERA
ncbi:UDP-2,4-diacetamido-2,4,6-trideoxy-beta-L-altropyranose hydrolase [Paenibacillus humicola]|uniref:UDP-2,4-diacetamido-2,4, 6-trideoxy-beta-L-altropyranose hydrolase n=1 Tax=Paenibacillus humicola TaxID=3110540 RepID=UPI00237ABDA8|nr:UDP-2,4-diacetamido-2,4,6-trideoxy-beta-L-altropyranose hydrolase [Paenibacillus humicola]